MKNIMFTTYFSHLEENLDLPNYNTILEFLLIANIQDKIARDKGIKKIMISLSSDIDKDQIEHFINNYKNKKKLSLGIINLPISMVNINWNGMTNENRKNFLIEKWKILFDNLSDDYFLGEKSEVLKALDKIKKTEWKIIYPLFKKKLKYKKEVYSICIDASVKRAQLFLVRETDDKKFALKDFETYKIHTDANFKNFKLEGDTLMFVNDNIFNVMFESPLIFDLKNIV